MWSPGTVDLPAATIRLVQLGPAGAPALVVVPDPPNVLEHHRRLLESLAQRWRIVAFELPGFGRSRLRGPLSFARVSAAVVALLDHLELRDVTLEMACIGAHVGLRVAHARPDRIARLVLIQTATAAQLRTWARGTDLAGLLHTPIVGQALCSLAARVMVRHWYGAALPAGTDRVTRAAYTAPALAGLAQGGRFPLAAAYQALARLPDPPGIEQPTHLVFGTGDRTHAGTAPDLLPHTTLERLPTCGHFPNLEAPAQHAARLEALLAV